MSTFILRLFTRLPLVFNDTIGVESSFLLFIFHLY